MDHESIRKWCMDRVYMKRTHDDFTENGTHFVQFENGDSYKLIEKEKTEWNKVSETYINGKLVNVSKWHFERFGWKLVSEVTF